jgi:hypothetical protein
MQPLGGSRKAEFLSDRNEIAQLSKIKHIYDFRINGVLNIYLILYRVDHNITPVAALTPPPECRRPSPRSDATPAVFGLPPQSHY